MFQIVLDALLKDLAEGKESALKDPTTSTLNYTRFACWYRQLVTLAMAVDQPRAIVFLQQVQPVILSSNGQYPEEDVQCLAVTAWNQGVELHG